MAELFLSQVFQIHMRSPGMVNTGVRLPRFDTPVVDVAVLVLTWAAISLVGFLGFSSPALLALDVYVDPQSESLPPDGTSEAPFLSLSQALKDLDWSQDNTFHLAPGNYSTEGEPLALSTGRGAVTVVGQKGSDGGFPKLIGAADSGPFFHVWSDGSTVDGRVEFRDLAFQGGDYGIVVLGGEAQRLTVVVEGCVFTDQRYQSVELVAGQFGSVDGRVERCQFSGSMKYALDVGTQGSSLLDVRILGNEFSGESHSVGGPIRNGVAVFLDEDATIRGTVERNLFRDTGTGLLVTSAEFWKTPGELQLQVIGNSVSGNPEPKLNGLQHGVYLSLYSHHSMDLVWLRNTIVGGTGYGFFFERYTVHPEDEGRCDRFTVEAAGNVIVGFEQGDLNLGAEDGLMDCILFRDNGLSDDGLVGVNGNVRATGNDLVWAGDRYRLADGSLLIDASEPPEERSEVDLSGDCRLTDGDGDGVFRIDLGAFESPGDCADNAMEFVRGDCDGNLRVELTDAIHELTFQFLGGVEVACKDACDTDDNGTSDLSDAIYILQFLFVGGAAPPPPHPTTGLDPTPDPLQTCMN